MGKKVNSLEEEIGSFNDVVKFVKGKLKNNSALELDLKIIPLGKLGDFSSEGEFFDTDYSSGNWKVKNRINANDEEGVLGTIKENLGYIKKGYYVESQKSEEEHKYNLTVYGSEQDARDFS